MYLVCFTVVFTCISYWTVYIILYAIIQQCNMKALLFKWTFTFSLKSEIFMSMHGNSWIIKFAFKMKHLQCIRVSSTVLVLGSPQRVKRTNNSTLREFIFEGVCLLRGDIKQIHTEQIKKIISDHLYQKDIWFDKCTSKDIWHFNWDLNDKEQVTQKPQSRQFWSHKKDKSANTQSL